MMLNKQDKIRKVSYVELDQDFYHLNIFGETTITIHDILQNDLSALFRLSVIDVDVRHGLEPCI